MDLRQLLKEKRKSALSPEKEAKIRLHLAEFCQKSRLKKWGLVWPLNLEPDLRPLCHFLYQNQFEVFLPETIQAERKLIFRRWSPATTMIKGAFGTCYPEGNIQNPKKIDGLIVPLLGYDSRGNRLGYGGGFYDRFLSQYPKILRLGYALSAQYSEILEVKEHDQRLDFICTEHGIATFPLRDRS